MKNYKLRKIRSRLDEEMNKKEAKKALYETFLNITCENDSKLHHELARTMTNIFINSFGKKDGWNSIDVSFNYLTNKIEVRLINDLGYFLCYEVPFINLFREDIKGSIDEDDIKEIKKTRKMLEICNNILDKELSNLMK